MLPRQPAPAPAAAANAGAAAVGSYDAMGQPLPLKLLVDFLAERFGGNAAPWDVPL